MTENTVLCTRCNRRLTDPDSIRAGYGPTCYRKIFDKDMPRLRKPRIKIDETLMYRLDDWLEEENIYVSN